MKKLIAILALLLTLGSITTVVQAQTPDITDEGLFGLRMCESTDNYTIDTGNGYYGAYQFRQATWDEVMDFMGMPDMIGVRPNLASPWVQDQAATWLWNGSGISYWGPHHFECAPSAIQAMNRERPQAPTPIFTAMTKVILAA